MILEICVKVPSGYARLRALNKASEATVFIPWGISQRLGAAWPPEKEVRK